MKSSWILRYWCLKALLWTLVFFWTPEVLLKASPFVRFQEVATGLAPLTGLANAGDGSGRLFVLEQRGTIRIIRAGELLGARFLDIRNKVDLSGEGGLVGLAFHPFFADNGRFFVSYLAQRLGEFWLVVAEYRADPESPDRASGQEKTVLVIPQPTPLHQGGDLAIGPDGFLYISCGDGGPGGDPVSCSGDIDA